MDAWLDLHEIQADEAILAVQADDRTLIIGCVACAQTSPPDFHNQLYNAIATYSCIWFLG
jgi:hypothetical protein